MSAFVVPNTHITVLAAFIVRQNLSAGRSVKEIGEILLNENIESIRTRYPNDRMNFRGFEIDEDAAFVHSSPVQIVKAADCLEYQSCEHDAYWESEAYKLTKAAYDAAMQLVNDASERVYRQDNIAAHPDYASCRYVITPASEA